MTVPAADHRHHPAIAPIRHLIGDQPVPLELTLGLAYTPNSSGGQVAVSTAKPPLRTVGIAARHPTGTWIAQSCQLHSVCATLIDALVMVLELERIGMEAGR